MPGVFRDRPRRRGRCHAVVFLAVLALLASACAAGAGERPDFDGARAYADVLRQCDFGPRNPGSEGHARCLSFLETRLKKLGAAVVRQPFKYALPGGKPIAMTNLVASFSPENRRRVLLAAHWDTRPWADLDADVTKRDLPILGANDGASGVAVLLEVARLVAGKKPDFGVDIVLFDGEDLGTAANPEGYFRGSREFAGRFRGPVPLYAILLDMVGDEDLLFYKEGYSAQAAPGTLDWLWKGGMEVAPAHFVDKIGYYVEDDHLSLHAVGIPAVDLIDFHYPHWHTHQDTPEHVSEASLQVVGDVLMRLLYPD